MSDMQKLVEITTTPRGSKLFLTQKGFDTSKNKNSLGSNI